MPHLLWFSKGALFFASWLHEKQAPAVLRQERSALHHIQLFPKEVFAGIGAARNLFVKILGEVRERYPFLLVGYVVMPEHVHLLISEPEQGNPSKVIRILKQRVSRAMRQKKRRRTARAQLRLPFPEEGKGLKRFWQRRFYDFNVWSTGKLKEKLNYMHANPVVRRLVKHPKNWPWSSWSFYEMGEAGLIRIDPVG